MGSRAPGWRSVWPTAMPSLGESPSIVQPNQMKERPGPTQTHRTLPVLVLGRRTRLWGPHDKAGKTRGQGHHLGAVTVGHAHGREQQGQCGREKGLSLGVEGGQRRGQGT